jgi:hypothetical protein
MLSGFNTNYRHRGVLFHVQTEDSGRENPHVITHLFHGGNIMSSHKQDYAGQLHLGEEALELEVKALMEGQHKTMLKQLSRGEHDQAISARMGPDVFSEPGIDQTDSADTIPPANAAPAPASTPGPQASAPADPSTPDSTQDRIARAFGDGVVSQKPLDEVVLDYLVENARKRKRSAK